MIAKHKVKQLSLYMKLMLLLILGTIPRAWWNTQWAVIHGAAFQESVD